ncbi:PINc/VapC family ATPase [Halanaeroarchaeum sulfurireducens]|uniref:ATPase n=1 Tax=Halanaeroarchaeum sulfurireducens TaxID=1604004 RepID=A0A0F7P6U6_9EURY|nr:PINc/VapC family ATPase [Halanaeroarchaeum sulfurireducens]AKH96896.1 ATPase [Halanaeroarchaeum sulfurireducens]ALG81298.1 ATPase [Halanaeroarchaeum sulfurireducens]
MKIVPDTSVVVDGRVSEKVAEGEYAGATIYLPEAVVGEIEAQANRGRDIGWDGIEELQRLAELDDDGEIEIEYVGGRATEGEIERASEGAIDAVIREVAVDYDATFVTSDIVQAEVGRGKGLTVEYLEPKERERGRLGIENYFDEETMSVHLKVGVVPMAKRGAVGDMSYQRIGEDPLDADLLKEFASEIIDAGKRGDDAFIELREEGMIIAQIRDMRIAIAEPPFSDGIEITAVRPIVKTTMEDYEHVEELQSRLLERDRGVLVAGAPGAGKSTFAQAVAEFLDDAGNVVKTMEKPRDLQVGPEITQYTELAGTMEKTADSLLMVRPDYTIYDEIRKTDDFGVFADMRLAGVGMVGVVHATRPIDALQRLVGRVELGMIPQIVDTVVFIEEGQIQTIYDVVTEVKVPQGLMEQDLARPVIVVRDFETQRPAYEIYTFNRQVVTVPLDGEDDSEESGVDRLAKNEVEREIEAATRGPIEVDISSPNQAIVYVSEDDISHVIGKGGGRISDIEERLGMSIDVRTLDEHPDHGTGGGNGARQTAEPSREQGEIVTPEITSRHVVIPVDGARAGETVEVQADGEYLFTATVGREGDIKVSRGSAIAEELERAIDREMMITVS